VLANEGVLDVFGHGRASTEHGVRASDSGAGAAAGVARGGIMAGVNRGDAQGVRPTSRGRRNLAKVQAVLAALARMGFVSTADGGRTFALRSVA
jgi:hypothetical protein